MLNAIVSSHCFLLSPESAPYALFDEGFEYGVRRVLWNSMLTLVHNSSGKLFSRRRAATGINRVWACLSMASSAIRTALRIVSIEPPRLSAPAMIVPPLRVTREKRAAKRDEHGDADSGT